MIFLYIINRRLRICLLVGVGAWIGIREVDCLVYNIIFIFTKSIFL